MSVRVPVTVRCDSVAPLSMTAAGVEGIAAFIDQLAANLRQVLHPHEKDQGAGVFAQGLPGDGAGFLGGVFVAGDEGHQGGVAPVGHGDAGIGRHRHRRGHAGDDLKGDARLGQFLGLFAAAAEDEGVAALEAHHGQAGPGPGHQ